MEYLDKINEELPDGEKIDIMQLRAAYALNMCTTSISQIVDYNDSYILDQEYDAILNNLNLENMPKNDALLKTLVELLNTITFFKIQEIKKKQIDKDYQRKMKNAIWSAVPNVSMFISAGSSMLVEGPLALLSVATTVGSAYMNYRKEKASALTEKEKAEVELEIAAIEQFDALRRELFTTSWRMAEEHNFPDKYRLTERQIKQYNEIIMDPDENRKYARLEYIQDKFRAYPPFWYIFGHTAHYIAEQNLPSDDDSEEIANEKALTRSQYLKKAKSHLDVFWEMNKYSILREDHMASSALLEYVDLLLLEEEPDLKAIGSMISEAVDHAGNSFDLLQMCAISYLKIGEYSEASRMLKMLVNEDYNASMNAKILSRIYVNDYVRNKSIEARAEYRILETRVSVEYLYPMPEEVSIESESEQLEEKFLSVQRKIVKSEYEMTLAAYRNAMRLRFNRVLPAPNKGVFVDTDEEDYAFRHNRMEEAKKLANNKGKWDPYATELAIVGFRMGYREILNDTVVAMEEIANIPISEGSRVLITENERFELQKKIRANIIDLAQKMTDYQNRMETMSFVLKDYEDMLCTVTYDRFTSDFFSELKRLISNRLEETKTISDIEQMDDNIVSFCEKYALPLPDVKASTRNPIAENSTSRQYILQSLFGVDSIQEKERLDRGEQQLQKIKNALKEVTGDSGNWKNFQVYMRDQDNFRSYMNESKLPVDVQKEALVIFDDKRGFVLERDLVLCIDTFVTTKDKGGVIERGKYTGVERDGKEPHIKLKHDGSEFYSNPNVNNAKLYELMKKLAE